MSFIIWDYQLPSASHSAKYLVVENGPLSSYVMLNSPVSRHPNSSPLWLESIRANCCKLPLTSKHELWWHHPQNHGGYKKVCIRTGWECFQRLQKSLHKMSLGVLATTRQDLASSA